MGQNVAALFVVTLFANALRSLFAAVASGMLVVVGGSIWLVRNARSPDPFDPVFVFSVMLTVDVAAIGLLVLGGRS